MLPLTVAHFSDDPEATKLRETIDADIVNIEISLSKLQSHMLALKVLARKFIRDQAQELARIASIEDLDERTRLLTKLVAPDIAWTA